jgi:hypothetical protein
LLSDSLGRVGRTVDFDFDGVTSSTQARPSRQPGSIRAAEFGNTPPVHFFPILRQASDERVSVGEARLIENPACPALPRKQIGDPVRCAIEVVANEHIHDRPPVGGQHASDVPARFLVELLFEAKSGAADVDRDAPELTIA